MYQRGSLAALDELPAWAPRKNTGWVLSLKYAARAMCLRPHCESPIEVMLGAELGTELERRAPGCWDVVPQHPIERFRFDFAVFRAGDRARPALLIECDGREFHSTPEQLQRDASKTDLCLAHGIPLLRFTGSEIYRDQRFCAEQCLACLQEE